MRILTGIAAAAGLAKGKAFVFVHSPVLADKTYIRKAQVPGEIDRFHKALERVSDELGALVNEGDTRDILETHLLMLADPEFKNGVEKEISEGCLCAPWAVEIITEKMVNALEVSEDQLFRERAVDFKDVSSQVIEELQGKRHHTLTGFDEDVVLVCDTLLPSELFTIDKKHVVGIALDGGGPTSHIAILTRSIRIPTVLALGSVSSKVHQGDEVIVDGNYGEVVIRPECHTVQLLDERFARYQEKEQVLEFLATQPTVTKDGSPLHIMANIEMVSEAETVKKVGAEGIGLYRSEYLLINNGENATEEMQFEDYRSVVQAMAPLPVTIRTFDIGGDKVVPGLGIDEQNPILGWRAVRFCLARKDIFSVQLRALLRASAYGKLRIMFPMISGVQELDEVLGVLENVKSQLDAEGIVYDKELQVGTMIEVPSAALCADLLATRVDFFSIGTNDLIQYTLAVDRGNEKIAYLYQPFHPAVLRSIKMVIDMAHQAHTPVGMCGEMAGDPMSSVLLAGLGLDEYSMDPQSVLPVRGTLRSVTREEAQKLAQEVMTLDRADKVMAYIRNWMHERNL